MTSAVASPSMVGRDADVQALRDALTESMLGRPRGVVIGGEAGIGKTRLIDEFVRELPPEVLVLTGQCVDLGSNGAPYAPMTSVLMALVRAVGADSVLEAAGPARSALTALLPELGEATEQPEETGSDRLYEVVAVLLENISRSRPLLIVVEDIHWADQGTLDLLRFLLRVLAGGRILVVLSYRSDDVPRGHVLRSYLPELERSKRVARRELRRLSRTQVRTQANEILGSGPDVDIAESLFDRSEGVPFFVEELLGFGASVLPETLRDLLMARYERLSPKTQGILRLISAGGVRVEHDLLAAVHTGPGEDLDVAAREGVLANVLVADDTGYVFRHALVREVIHDDLLPGERARFHTGYAEALEASGGAATEISYHWMIAHDVGKAFQASMAAMTEARATYALGTAARMGERALELWNQVPDAETVAGRRKIDLMIHTASALRNAGEGERALAVTEAGFAECPPGDTDTYAGLLGDKARYLANLDRPGSIELLQEALRIVDRKRASGLSASLLVDLAGRFMLEARFDEASDVADQAFAEAERADSSRRMSIARNIKGVSLVNRGDIDDGLANLEQARLRAAGDDNPLLRYRVNASDIMNLLGRFDEAVRIAEAGMDRARMLGVERTTGIMLSSNTVEPLLAAGDWPRAEALLDRALDLDPSQGFRVHLQRMRLWLTLWRGDAGGADRMLDGWRSNIQVELAMQSKLGFARVAAEIALERGRFDAAWAEVSILTSDARRPMPGYDLPLLAVAAHALAINRQPGGAMGADRAAGEEANLRQVFDQVIEWPTTGVWSAVFEAELGGQAHTGTDPVRWQQAADAVTSRRAPAHLKPYVLLRLAQAQVTAGDRGAAARNARDARARAEKIGAGLIVAKVDALAERAGIDVGAGGSGRTRNVHGLTDRERQVLELLGRGMSNRQIGEQLFISTKTASVHVSGILRKLGAGTRTEAVFVAKQRGALMS